MSNAKEQKLVGTNGKKRDYTDYEEVYVKKGFVLEFIHIPTGKRVEFKALLTRFSDRYDSDWNEESVYGRMDTIDNFKGTKRVISIGWDLVAASIEEARVNLSRASLLFAMLYPMYRDSNNSSAICASPLFRLSFANLIQDVGDNRSTDYGDKFTPNTSSGNNKFSLGRGLVGRIAGFVYEPDLDQGMFPMGNKLYPQTINLSCDFNVKHLHRLGWGEDGNFRDHVLFPYDEPFPGSQNVSLKNSSVTAKTDEQLASQTHKITKSKNGFGKDYFNIDPQQSFLRRNK
jgi:hypothetical protein